MPRIKVCCIESEYEAALAVRSGAAAIGLVSAMPSGPGPIREDRIAAIASAVRGRVSTFLLTSLVDPEAIVAQHARCGTDTIQLVDRMSAGSRAFVKQRLPDVSLVQVVHVVGEESLEEAKEAERFADAVLLDSGRPTDAVKVLGGTGKVHDWTISRSIVDRATVPVWLAGGLRPDNVAAAVESVSPSGVDVCSGLRTQGRLDAEKLKAFVEVVGASGD